MAFDLLSRSAAAGMDVAGHAPTDDDLEPLHSDRRWHATTQQWKRQHAEWNAREVERKRTIGKDAGKAADQDER